MLKKNCHQVLGSQKSKLTPPELVFQTAGAINPPPYQDRVKRDFVLCWLAADYTLTCLGRFYVNTSNLALISYRSDFCCHSC